MYGFATAVSLDSTPESCARQHLTQATAVAALTACRSGIDMKTLALSMACNSLNSALLFYSEVAPAAAAAVAAPAGPVQSLGFGAW